MPILEEWNVACGLASLQGFKGVYKGYVTDLAKEYLDTLSKEDLSQVEIYSCGPQPMLEAVAKLARDYNLTCPGFIRRIYGLCGGWFVLGV